MNHLQNKTPTQVSKRKWAVPLLVALLSATISVPTPSVAAAIDPLFSDDAPLELTLNAPIRAITRDRSEEPKDRPGKLGYTDAAGNEIWMDIGIRARGKSRRDKEVCRFPPLRVNIKTKQAANSIFAHQDKLKLVTHCKPSSRFEQFLLMEYLAYKTLNLLTDHSFQVRLLKVHYLDGDKDLGTFNGFFIEHKDRLAKRIDRQVAKPVSIVAGQLELEHTGIVELFQLMIGNTDFSFLKGPTGDVCCHNVVLFEKDGRFQAIPYDFDVTGLVNPPYAVPNEALPLNKVTKRLFRGFCRSEEALDNTLHRFETRKAAIYELFDEKTDQENFGLTTRTSSKAKKYLDGFYAIIEDPKQIDRKIGRKCR